MEFEKEMAELLSQLTPEQKLMLRDFLTDWNGEIEAMRLFAQQFWSATTS